MIRYEGTIEALITRQRFYEIISDPQKLIGFLPDVVESSVADPEHFNVKARLGAGPLKDTLDFSFETLEKKEGYLSKLKGHGRGMQSSVDITLQITLEDRPAGCRASWVAEASVGGLLASLGARLIDGIAAKYVKQITENLQRQVST